MTIVNASSLAHLPRLPMASLSRGWSDADDRHWSARSALFVAAGFSLAAWGLVAWAIASIL